ncbi:MAG TPA: hypothetical protein VMX14_09835, partial [Anaerolineae bacterium]|nr:hypothetical protein [Anaerolineae bacterium]
MRQSEAKRWVMELTVRSLRRMVDRVRMGDLDSKSTQKDVSKVKLELRRLAEQLEKRLGGAVMQTKDGHLEGVYADAAEAGAPSPDKGENDIPQDGDPPGGGDPVVTASLHKPKAR